MHIYQELTFKQFGNVVECYITKNTEISSRGIELNVYRIHQSQTLNRFAQPHCTCMVWAWHQCA
jgi:hypothetical protein